MRFMLGVFVATLVLARPSQAQVVRLEFDSPEETDSSAVTDATGSVVYTVTTSDPFGTNPGYRKQIFRWDPVTGMGTQVTSYEEGVESVSVSGDGGWLAFVSNADLLGTNHDESPELYVMQSNGSGLAQLTSADVLPFRGVTAAVLSGSANRIAFSGSIDPLGTNPTYSNALFVIDRNGTNLRQLATDVATKFDISDDGSKVVYIKAGELLGINANGTGNHTFSSTTSVSDAKISGNGAKVVYTSGPGFPGSNIKARNFDGASGPASLGSGDRPSITDDATVVYHRRDDFPDGIYRINSTGGTATLVAELEFLVASGNGARLVARNAGLVALDNAGGSLQQLTLPTFDSPQLRADALSLDGNRLWFISNQAPHDLFAYDFDTATLHQLTDASIPPFQNNEFDVTDAGDIIFTSRANPTGQNPCGALQLFRLLPDGTGLTQLTTCIPPQNPGVGFPSISGDGQIIIFQSFGNLIRINGDGSGRTQITADGQVQGEGPSVAEGTNPWVAYTSSTNFDGLNPTGRQQIFRIRSDGSGRQRITAGDAESRLPSISGDGSRIAWLSFADLTGGNPDHSLEAFVYDATTQAITQLTDGGTRFTIRITRDGEWVFTGNMRFAADTGLADIASGFLHATSSVGGIIANATGSHWVFSGQDVIDRSPSGLSFYRADLTAVPKIQVDPESPTVVTWDPSPGSVRYDVVRGSISNLAISGSTVDLGPVVCLEDESPDNHTRGHEDVAEPAPGEAFFFLYRGSMWATATTGSYGQGTGGRERSAGAGGCNP